MIRTWVDALGERNRVRSRAAVTGDAFRSSELKELGSVGGVILAGVHRWGDNVLDRAMPRPLLPIANRPLIDYSLDWLSSAGLSQVCVCANSSTKLIRGELKRRPPCNAAIHYYEDVMPRGPAGCMRDAWPEGAFDTLVVVDGTMIPRVDLTEALHTHLSQEAMMTVIVSTARRSGRHRDDAMSPTGIYLFSSRVLEYVPTTGYQDIKEKLIPHLYKHGERLTTHEVKSPAPRVKCADSYLSVNDWAVELLLSHPEPPAEFRQVGEGWVHENAQIGSNVNIIGPVLVGPGVTLDDDVTLVGPTSIGSGCQLDAGTVVCRSAIWDHCHLGEAAVLDRCVLVHHAEVAPEESVRYAVWTRMHRKRRLVSRVTSWAKPGRPAHH